MRTRTNFNFDNKSNLKKLVLTATTTDLGIWLNGKISLYLGDLANPKIGLNLVPNPL